MLCGPRLKGLNLLQVATPKVHILARQHLSMSTPTAASVEEALLRPPPPHPGRLALDHLRELHAHLSGAWETVAQVAASNDELTAVHPEHPALYSPLPPPYAGLPE